MKRFHLAVLVVVLSALGGCAERAPYDGEDEPLIVEFERRVNDYVDLRDRLDTGAARLKETRKPDEIIEAEKALGAKVIEARAAAKHGDIFTPEIRNRFRQLLNPELNGKDGSNTRGVIMDENPGEFPFKVNTVYPKEQPLATIPPNILDSLPRLPEGIEYRFVDKHLILRDARANVIVDYIPNAIS